MSKKYDIDFKDSVIMFYREAKKIPNAKAFRDTIKRFGLNHQTLSRWIHEYEAEPMLGPITGPDMLKEENKFNDAYFQRAWKEVESAPAEVHVTEKWQENVRDDYDHISEWGVLVTTELIFLLTLCHSHIRHAGGKARKDIDDIIFKLKYQLRNS